MEMSREELNALRSECAEVTEDEREHFYVCDVCGQAVDARRLGDVLYHDEPIHSPLPVQ
jgi:hypothetical protein